MNWDSLSLLSAALISACVYLLHRRLFRRCLSDLPGPDRDSLWLGNLGFLFQSQAGEADLELQERYGSVIRLHATLGGDILLLSDPRAIQHVLQPGYDYCKCTERRFNLRMMFGHGVIWADGDGHKRQRKVLQPAFGASESKALFPIMVRRAEALAEKWKDSFDLASNQAKVFNVAPWLLRATLDVMGEAAFDYDFGALADNDNELTNAYHDMMPVMFASPSARRIFVLDMYRFLSLPITEWIQDHTNNIALDKSRRIEKAANKVARQLVAQKDELWKQGRGTKDVFSLIVKANASQNERSCLSEREMYDNMRTVLLAGHDTTTNVISFTLLELARNPTAQSRLRAEIRACESAMHARGQTDFSTADLDNMPYLQAVTKETLRLNPVLPHLFRKATKDDTLPLARPVATRSGRMITSLLVAKGTPLIISINAYNRHPDIWGENPNVFDPGRWLDGRLKSPHTLGIYNNLLSFGGGARSCIGWRFATYEVQAFLIELVSQLEFRPSADDSKIRRELCAVMAPTVKGDAKAVNLPLEVSLASQDP